MKSLKLAGIVIGGVVLIIAAGVAVVASRFDADRIKTELATMVLDKSGRTLKIDGDLRLSLWPAAGVKIGKASLSEHNSQKVFATVDSGRLSVALIPLLSRQIVIDAIDVNGLNLALVKRKDGTLNVSEGVSGSGTSGAPTPGNAAPGSAKPGAENRSGAPTKNESLQIDISSLKVTNSRLDWRDEKSGSSTSVTDLNLSTGRIKSDTGRNEYQVEALVLTAKTKTGANDVSVKLESPRLASAPDKPGGQSAILSAIVSGPDHKMDLRLALAGIERAARDITVGSMTLDVDATSGTSTIKAAFTSPLKANLDSHILVSEQLTGSVDIAHPRMPMKSIKLPINGALHADLDKLAIDGNVTTKFDDSRLALKFNVPKMSPLIASFDLDCDQINIDRYFPKTKAAAVPVTSPATARPAPPAPTPPAAPTASSSSAAPPSSAGSPAPSSVPASNATKEVAGTAAGGAPGEVDFSGLKNLTLTGSIKVGSLQASIVKASNVSLKLKTENGRLDVAPHSATLYGGTITGALSLNSNGNVVTARENLSGVNINGLLKDAVDKDLLEGRGSLIFDVTTRGDTVPAMKKSIAGTASLVLKDGSLKGINLAKTFRELKASFSGHQDAVQQASAVDKTDFSDLSASFRMAKGVAHNDDLAVKSPFLRLSGAGDIDIGSNNLNYLLKASVVNTSGGQGAKDLEFLQGVTVPVRASGPFEHLTYKVQFADMATYALKARVQEKKQELTRQLKDQLKDKLKGLFGK
ncbi:MAG: putative AsmA family protein [Herminiimonas sp.]|nr:putative AsmA family protein [Herminiimonas sp.]